MARTLPKKIISDREDIDQFLGPEGGPHWFPIAAGKEVRWSGRIGVLKYTCNHTL
jgi:hypothetical protein